MPRERAQFANKEANPRANIGLHILELTGAAREIAGLP
jgi:hypothetical protein